MASTGKVSVTVNGGGFEPGEKVGLSVRYGDFYLPGQGQVAKATVADDGEIRFDGVEVGKYWVHRLEDPYRALAVHAKQRQAAAEKPDAETVRRRLEATRPVVARSEIITGAVGTGHVQRGRHGGQFAHSQFTTEGLRPPGDLADGVEWRPEDVVRGTPVGHPTAEGDVPAEGLAQEDARDLDQRSATVTGTAEPIPEGEIVPAPRQDQVPADTAQASATELGVATPLPGGPVVQEEARDIAQRSATRTGTAEPVPSRDAPAAKKRARPKASAKKKPAARKKAAARKPPARGKSGKQGK